MASTGEVACFASTKYEAYLKALLSTGFSLPKKNILLSVGSFKEKKELLPLVERLHQCGYALFATPGTADYYTEHGVPVSTLVDIESNDPSKKEYSLTEYLANNLIDLYVNLPSKNKYRRPANYMSKGYRTRRMAVDFSIPLISNVKCAKLFFEAICRNKSYTFDLSVLDFKTSHRIAHFPGFIDVCADAPKAPGTEELSSPLSSGFIVSCAVPGSFVKGLGDAVGFTPFYDPVKDHGVGGRIENAIRFFGRETDPLRDFAPFLESPESKGAVCIFAEYSGMQLATALFYAHLKGFALHISQVFRKADLVTIILAKRNGVRVTCDVAIFNLFVRANEHPALVDYLGSDEDISFLWENLEHVDCLTTGRVGMIYDKAGQFVYDYAQVLPLLIGGGQRQLSEAFLVEKLHTNPRRILGLDGFPDCAVIVEVDRAFVDGTLSVSAGFGRSLVSGKALNGYVDRITVDGKQVYVDGQCSVAKKAVQDLQLAPSRTDTPIAKKNLKPREALQVDKPMTPLKIETQTAAAPTPVLSTKLGSPTRLNDFLGPLARGSVV